MRHFVTIILALLLAACYVSPKDYDESTAAASAAVVDDPDAGAYAWQEHVGARDVDAGGVTYSERWYSLEAPTSTQPVGIAGQSFVHNTGQCACNSQCFDTVVSTGVNLPYMAGYDPTKLTASLTIEQEFAPEEEPEVCASTTGQNEIYLQVIWPDGLGNRIELRPIKVWTWGPAEDYRTALQFDGSTVWGVPGSSETWAYFTHANGTPRYFWRSGAAGAQHVTYDGHPVRFDGLEVGSGGLHPQVFSGALGEIAEGAIAVWERFEGDPPELVVTLEYEPLNTTGPIELARWTQ